MSATGDLNRTLDDSSLLRAIVEHEDGLDGNTLHKSVVYLYLSDSINFEILKSNDHLRSLLKDFLIANIRVREVKNLINKYDVKLIRIKKRSHLKALRKELVELVDVRDKAFQAYEMLRKLSVPVTEEVISIFERKLA